METFWKRTDEGDGCPLRTYLTLLSRTLKNGEDGKVSAMRILPE